MEAVRPPSDLQDGPMVAALLDWRELGMRAVREALEADFAWTSEHPQSSYPSDVEIPATVRRGWHPAANQFYLYWRAKRVALGRIPDRADLDPLLEIPLLCRYICIFEPATREGFGPDWFCRLMGTHVETALGILLTGRFVSDYVDDPSRAQILRYHEIVEKSVISHRSGPARARVDDRFGWVESLYFPITDLRRKTVAAFGVAIYQKLRG